MARVRITGVTVPWFGVSWEYRDRDRDVVRRIFADLEDRRVLYTHPPDQNFSYAALSAREIRGMLRTELGAAGLGKELVERLRIIRAALRKFMDFLEKEDGWAQRLLALGEMRGRVNPILAELAIKYKIEVEEELATVLQPLELSSED